MVMSRHADSGSINAAIQAGALAFVPKTESADELIAAIKSAAKRRHHLPEPAATLLAGFRAAPDAGLGRQDPERIGGVRLGSGVLLPLWPRPHLILQNVLYNLNDF